MRFGSYYFDVSVKIQLCAKAWIGFFALLKNWVPFYHNGVQFIRKITHHALVLLNALKKKKKKKNYPGINE